MRFAQHCRSLLALIAVAISAVATTPASAHDGWKHRHKHHHRHQLHRRDYGLATIPATAGHLRAARRVSRSADVLRAMGPPSLNVIIPLR